MRMTRRSVLGSAAAAATLSPIRSRAQSPGLRIGVLGDESGVYRELSGPVAIAAVKLAVADWKSAGRDIPVETSPATTRTGRMSAPAWRGSGSTATRWT
jgi:branched-chain amino acid transport system substrate-binding protein